MNEFLQSTVEGLRNLVKDTPEEDREDLIDLLRDVKLECEDLLDQLDAGADSVPTPPVSDRVEMEDEVEQVPRGTATHERVREDDTPAVDFDALRRAARAGA